MKSSKKMTCTCMMNGGMCMCGTMDMCFGYEKRKAASDASV